MEENLNKMTKNATANAAQAPAAGGKNKEGKPGKTCFQCQRKGHFTSDCYTMKLKDRKELPSRMSNCERPAERGWRVKRCCNRGMRVDSNYRPS